MQHPGVPPRRTRTRAPHARSPWSTEELVVALFLRSRRVSDGATRIILNERYAPKVRQLGAIRNKLQALRTSEHGSGRIDLTHDKYFTRPENVDHWIRSQIENAHARSALLTFTEHEFEIMGGTRRRKNFSLDETLPVAGPSQAPPDRGFPRREDTLPLIGPSQMPVNQATRRREDFLPAVGSSQVLDQSTGQVITGQRQMSEFSTINPNEWPDPSEWPVWNPTLESLVPNLRPPATQGASSFTMQPEAGDASARNYYQESQGLEEWSNLQGEEYKDGGEEDEVEEDEVEEDDVDDDDQYRFQRDENDNTWYDEDQEEEDA